MTRFTKPEESREYRDYWPFDTLPSASYTANSSIAIGQVAQLVERGPEKAGVGGSIPSLATILFNNLASLKKRVKISRANNTRTSNFSHFTFGVAQIIEPSINHVPVLDGS